MTFKVYIKLKHENILCRNPKSRHLAAMEERGNSSGKVLTKENEQPCIPVCDEKPISILETRTRISFFQSHVRDEKENFFLSISCFETRTRIFFNLRHRDENENHIHHICRRRGWSILALISVLYSVLHHSPMQSMHIMKAKRAPFRTSNIGIYVKKWKSLF